MSARSARALRVLGGAAVLAVALVVAGPDAVPTALRAVDLPTLTVGATLGAVTTVAGAWRWLVVARGLGVPLRLPAAVAACYRSQLLNATLPGGVLGDVDRGAGHGRAVGDVGRGLRAVAWERTCGYLVLAVLTVPVLGALAASRTPPPSVPWWAPVAVGGVVGAGVLAARHRGRGALVGRMTRALVADARALAGRRAVATVVATSVVVVAGHVATFVLAARVVGVAVDLAGLVPLALVVLLVGALPVNVAGWGPREGAAAWAFATAGLGAGPGVSVAVVHGLIGLVAALPGVVVLLAVRGGAARG